MRKANLTPFLIGAADLSLLTACTGKGVPAAGIIPELDVWTYTRKPKSAKLYEMKSDWGYMRHHKSDFLEMGLVKVAFLWELLSVGFDVLISDLDVVWLNGHWQRWTTWADSLNPPVPEASLLAAADVLVTTDELDSAKDSTGSASAMELNTGVVYLRATRGALAMVQSWRKAMLRQKGRHDLTENVNDQSLFNQVVRGTPINNLLQWQSELREANVTIPKSAFSSLPPNYRRVRRTSATHEPCLPGGGCQPVSFTYGTLPIRPFTGGHTWFNQNVQEMEGESGLLAHISGARAHISAGVLIIYVLALTPSFTLLAPSFTLLAPIGHELPQNEPITVHFTFQFGDTKE